MGCVCLSLAGHSSSLAFYAETIRRITCTFFLQSSQPLFPPSRLSHGQTIHCPSAA